MIDDNHNDIENCTRRLHFHPVIVNITIYVQLIMLLLLKEYFSGPFLRLSFQFLVHFFLGKNSNALYGSGYVCTYKIKK